MFKEFQRYHRKFYFNSEEEEYRFAIYKDAKNKMLEHNSNPDNTFKMGVTKFTDLTQEEFLRMYTGAKH